MAQFELFFEELKPNFSFGRKCSQKTSSTSSQKSVLISTFPAILRKRTFFFVMKAAHNTRKQYLYVNAYYGLQSGICLLLFLSAVHLIASPKPVLAVELPLYPLKFDRFQEIVGK